MEQTLPKTRSAVNDNRLLKFLQSLIEPHNSISERTQRRRSQLLATIIAVMLTVGAIVLPYEFITSENPSEIDLVLPIIGWFVIVGLYFLNRSGRVEITASTLVVMFVIMFAVPPLFPEARETVVYYSFVAVLLTAVFFSPRWVFVSAVGVAGILLVGPNFVADSVPAEVQRDFLIFLTFSTVVVATFMWHTRRMEEIRTNELRAANELLRESEARLEKRVAERTQDLERARNEAEAARQEAVEANQMKSQFLASMSHELRTPLNSILTFTELIAMGTFGDVNAEQRDYLLKSLNSGKHLLSLINDVLDITKIQSGMMKLFVEDNFDANAELDAIATSAEKMLDSKPVQLVRDIDPNLPKLTCDKRRVRQVLLNLTSNAVKFTEDGTVTLSAKRRANDILFAVSDTGPGIATEDYDLVFEPFIQTETGIRHAGGTGLGLPISKRLVEAHGGKLWLESRVGEGSAFYVTIPLEPVMEPGEKEMKQ